MRTKTEERRLAILDVAERVFREVGYEKASMAEISGQVGGSKATLYNYFPSKSQLFLAVMDAAARQRVQECFSQLSHDEPLRTLLQRFGCHLMHALMSDPIVGTLRMAVHEAERTEVGRLMYEQAILPGWSRVETFLQACMDKGDLPPANARLAALHLKALYEAEMREPRMLGCLSVAEAAAMTDAAVQRGLDVWWRAYGPATGPTH